MLDFLSNQLMNQYVHIPTRKNNILDLFITNDHNNNMVASVKSTTTTLSDHNIVDIMLTFNPAQMRNQKCSSLTFDENSFSSLNFHIADFYGIKVKLGELDWDS